MEGTPLTQGFPIGGTASPVSNAGNAIAGERVNHQEVPKVDSLAGTHRPWAAIFGIIATVIFMVAVFIVYFMNVQTSAMITSEQGKIDTLSKSLTTEPLASIAKQAQALTRAVNSYGSAAAKQLDESLLTSELATLTPKTVRLDTVNIEDKGTVRVTGTAPDFAEAGKVLLAYRRSSYMKSLNLATVSLVDSAGKQSVTFTIVATLDKNALKNRGSKAVTQQLDQ